ncbi:PqqD family protein [Pelagicoccus sp. SDUM812003]|uniref:PqqD family protein n=1 Tax=Pelagicoccus sp. SDUM812003 TaxID=3041267 RepID=UPI00280E38E6|nr:PqqD family protein [Pelagicoccus sp. SDUM812003]MDQ8202801.1 PqqD family protein [Pelagicoccus sp. SDUM812003]
MNNTTQSPLLKRRSDLVDTELEDLRVFLDAESGKYFGMNQVASRIWDLLETPTSPEQIYAQILSEFKVDQSTCREEVGQFISELQENGLVTKVTA